MYVLDNRGNRTAINKFYQPVIENYDNPLKGKSNTNKILLVSALIISLLVIVGGSYAMYRYIKNPSSKKESFGYRL
jgi:hypothetical protein